ncbi:MAG: hypothetical protein A2V79_05210 [Betaproteobacteria bacterium RBG_16_56_24]|nr:MAG: hypothetical protein A2V79_05210 [Betaproteobacteria bacterium RBG_16_56_24]
MENKLLTVFLASNLGIVAAFAATGAWAVEGGNFDLATGFDYSSGKYGSASATSIFSIPVTGRYMTGLWVFKLTVPYVRISGTTDVVSGGKRFRAITTTATTTVSTTRSGLGDVVAAATYDAYSGSEDDFGIYLTGRVKFGTADTSLGTGQNDYAAQADVYQGFDSFTAMGALGYEVLGSTTGVDLNNVVYGTLGGNFQFTDQTSSGAEMRLSQKPSAAGAGQRELTVYASHRIGESLSVRGYALKGFSDGSPDSGFGVMVSSDF